MRSRALRAAGRTAAAMLLAAAAACAGGCAAPLPASDGGDAGQEEAVQDDVSPKEDAVGKMREQADEEDREQAQRAEQARARLSTITLSDAAALAAAGVPAKCADRLCRDFERWCSKHDMAPERVIRASDVSSDGKGSATVSLTAYRAFTGGDEALSVTARCQKGNNGFSCD